MSPLRRALTILALACAIVVAQAPRNDANAFVPILGAIPTIAGWLGIGSAVAVAINVATGSNVTGALAESAANAGAWAANALGATQTAENLRTLGQAANTGLGIATQAVTAFAGFRPPPDPDDIAARAIAFANGPPILAPFVRGFVETAAQVGQQFGTRIAAEVLTLLNYVFLIWLLLQVAQMMLGMARGSEIFWNIVKRGAIYMILVAMLAGVQSGEYWRWFVQEPLQATSSMTQAMAGGASGSIGGCAAAGGGDAAAAAESIACVTERVLRGGIATGWTLIAATPFRITQPNDMPKGLANILGGIGLCIFFGLAMIYFGFFVIDVFLRVLVLAMFSPIFIALYLIQATRSVTRNAINNLIGSLFTLLGAVAVLSIVGSLIGSLIGGGAAGAPWDALIHQYAKDAVNLSPNVGLGDSRYWTLAFAALTLIGSAKAIGGLMGGVFGGAAAGTVADKATSLAALPIKAAATGAMLATGGAAMVGGRLAGSALSTAGGALSTVGGATARGIGYMASGTVSMARRQMGWGP
jgi:hypothetical protein